MTYGFSASLYTASRKSTWPMSDRRVKKNRTMANVWNSLRDVVSVLTEGYGTDRRPPPHRWCCPRAEAPGLRRTGWSSVRSAGTGTPLSRDCDPSGVQRDSKAKQQMDLLPLNVLQSQKKNAPAPPELPGHQKQLSTNLSKVVCVLLIVWTILRRTENRDLIQTYTEARQVEIKGHSRCCCGGLWSSAASCPPGLWWRRPAFSYTPWDEIRRYHRLQRSWE